MISRFRLPLGALVVAFAAGAAMAGPAVLSADMMLHEGPGDEYSTLGVVPGGARVDLRKCNTEQWCLVKHRDLTGWIHVQRVDVARKAGSADSDTGASNDSTGPGDAAGGKKGFGRPKPPGGDDDDEGMSSKDAASLPGSTAGDRLAASGGGNDKPGRLEASSGPAKPAGAYKE